MKTNFANLTDEELEKVRKALNEEINKRKEEEKEKYKKELEDLLIRVNELQNKYGFRISCETFDGDWVSSVFSFELEN